MHNHNIPPPFKTKAGQSKQSQREQRERVGSMCNRRVVGVEGRYTMIVEKGVMDMWYRLARRAWPLSR